MTNNKNIDYLNMQWDDFINRIANSKRKYKDTKSIKIVDIEFTRHKIETDDKFCLVCYRLTDDLAPSEKYRNNLKGTKVIITKKSFIDYYINGYDKSEELHDLKEIYQYNSILKKEIKETNDFSRSDEFLQANQQIWYSIREKNRLGNEARIVKILFKHFKLQ